MLGRQDFVTKQDCSQNGVQVKIAAFIIIVGQLEC